MEYKKKEVLFVDYCYTCKNNDKNEDEDPCNECLTTPARENSHKPLKYESAINR